MTAELREARTPTASSQRAKETEPLAVDAKRVGQLLGISRAQVWKLHASGRLPLPVRLGTRAPRWRVDELRDWLAAGCPDRQMWQGMRKHGR